MGAGPPVMPADQARDMPRSRWRFLRRLNSVRLRLAAIVLVASVPLLLLSTMIAWQNYRLALDEGTESAARLGEAVFAQQVAAIGAMQQMLQLVAEMPELTEPQPGACDARLTHILAMQQARYADLALFDHRGQRLCGAPGLTGGSDFADYAPLFAAASHAPSGFAIGAIRHAGDGRPGLLPAAQRVRHFSGDRAFLIATLRLDWLGKVLAETVSGVDAVWLADGGDHLTPLLPGSTVPQPNAAQIARLIRENRAELSPSADGIERTFASAPLPGALHVVVAYPAASALQHAGTLLTQHMLQLALLLGLGLAAIGLGTHRALIEPLDGLGRAVERWRAGGRFDVALVRLPPREIAALAHSFAEATESLAEQGERLRKAALQQDLLMKEIHHRVKNNLQIIASLLNLQASRIRLPAARTEFASARDRVRALATLHRHLYSQGELTTISMRPFLEELIGQLFDAMGEREGTRIRLSIETTPLQLSSDQAVPLALIVTEAVSNALKYAFPRGRSGHVGVQLTAQEESLVLVVEDDGIGIPPGPAETETGARDGLGIQLIRGFAKQLGATLEVRQEHGTRYRLVFKPVAEEAAG